MLNKQIFVSYGEQAKKMTKELLEKIDLKAELKKDDLIALKPNLVNASSSEKGATTDPQIAAALIEYLINKGFEKLIIIEGSWVGADTDNAFLKCGYQELAAKYEIPLYNLQKSSYKQKKVLDMEIEIAEIALKVDYLINLPVLKGHCQTNITCALKNLKGCLSDQEKRRFHRIGLHKSIAYLNKALKQDLIIVDGIYGDLDFEEGGNAVKMNRILAAKDPVLVDSYAAELLGYHISEIPYLQIAAEIGVGNNNLDKAEIIEMNKDQAADINYNSSKIEQLTKKIKAKNACSACYGSLIHALKRLDERGKLKRINQAIYLGQAYQAKEIAGLGIGNCCNQAAEFVKGCPPSAKEIIDFLNDQNM